MREPDELFIYRIPTLDGEGVGLERAMGRRRVAPLRVPLDRRPDGRCATCGCAAAHVPASLVDCDPATATAGLPAALVLDVTWRCTACGVYCQWWRG